jgi:hypothetical protein
MRQDKRHNGQHETRMGHETTGRHFMNKTSLIILAVAVILTATGCAKSFKQATSDTYDTIFDTAPTTRTYHDDAGVPIESINYKAADVLYSNISKSELSAKSPIYAKRFENQEDPADKTIFGTVVMEQVVDRLVQRGLVITGGNPSPADYTLPRDVDPEKYTHPAPGSLDKLPPRAAILSGTYVLGDSSIYISSKVTRLDDRAVVSAHTWTIPISDNVRQLLPQLRKDEGLKPTVKTSFD